MKFKVKSQLLVVWSRSHVREAMSHVNCSPKGIASLPAVLVLGVIILAISVSIATVSFSESFISQGSAQSSKSLFYAESGARDALVKIARNKNYTCSSADCYSLAFVTSGCTANLGGCAKVSVSAGVGTVGDPKIITSKGQVSASSRIINVNVILDTSGDGSIATTTWSENIN